MTKISVIIPTFKRPDLLARCLDALARQNLAREDFEIIVADNANEAQTRLLVENLAGKSPVNLRYVEAREKSGPAFARNVGWRAANGEIIAFSDDDCVPDQNWLHESLEIFENEGETAAIAGKIEMPLPAKPTDYELNEFGLTNAEFVTANCFVRRRVLIEIGGFDERFTAAWREDSDLHFRLLRDNRQIRRAENAIVRHPIRPARFGISLAQQRKSMFDALLFRKHPELFRAKIKFSPLAFYLNLLAFDAAVAAAFFGLKLPALAAFGIWFGLTARFCFKRLRRTSRAPIHLLEMILTSALIPPVAVFWRLRGALKFRVFFF